MNRGGSPQWGRSYDWGCFGDGAWWRRTLPVTLGPDLRSRNSIHMAKASCIYLGISAARESREMHRINALSVVVRKMAGMTPGDLLNIHGSGMSPQESLIPQPRPPPPSNKAQQC